MPVKLGIKEFKLFLFTQSSLGDCIHTLHSPSWFLDGTRVWLNNLFNNNNMSFSETLTNYLQKHSLTIDENEFIHGLFTVLLIGDTCKYFHPIARKAIIKAWGGGGGDVHRVNKVIFKVNRNLKSELQSEYNEFMQQIASNRGILFRIQTLLNTLLYESKSYHKEIIYIKECMFSTSKDFQTRFPNEIQEVIAENVEKLKQIFIIQDKVCFD